MLHPSEEAMPSEKLCITEKGAYLEEMINERNNAAMKRESIRSSERREKKL